jgi:hypothetical protein
MLNCYQKREEPVTTNADRIRAMNDEELAGAIFDFQIRVLTANPMLERPASREQILAYLRSPSPSGPTRASGISKGESHD